VIGAALQRLSATGTLLLGAASNRDGAMIPTAPTNGATPGPLHHLPHRPLTGRWSSPGFDDS
jgi:hypothetical protein